MSYTQQKTLESEMLIKASELEKSNHKNTIIEDYNIETGDEIRNMMNDILYSIDMNSQKKKKSNNGKSGGY